MRVLLAEDDALTRFMMAEMLDELEVDYDICANGEEALAMVTAAPDRYALVLMDIHMPVLTGLEALHEIRKVAHNPPRDIPIIAVTADQNWQSPARCVNEGFTGVLSKPVTMSRLENELSQLRAG